MDVIKLREDLQRDEGWRQWAYHDTSGVLTIGYGRNINASGPGISRDEALYLLDNDITRVCRQLDMHIVWWRSLDDARARALANMAFNLGIAGLQKFSMMLTALHAGDWNTAAAEALDSRWAQQVGDRAKRIAEIFRTGAE